MKNANSYTEFVEYDDENLSHVSCGPHFGNKNDISGLSPDDSFEEYYRDRYIFNGFSFGLVLNS